MITTEKALAKWLKENFPGAWSKIEAPTATGIPDLFYAMKGLNGFMELKVVRGKIKKIERVKKIQIRPSQVAWIKRNTALGVNVHLVFKWDRVDDLDPSKCFQKITFFPGAKVDWLKNECFPFYNVIVQGVTVDLPMTEEGKSHVKEFLKKSQKRY